MKLKCNDDLICVTCLWIYYFVTTVRSAAVNPTCLPVTVPMCLPDSDVISLQLPHDKENSDLTAATPQHRKTRSRRNIRNNEIIPWRYNTTTFPTFANDKSELDIMISVSAFHPLLSTKCSKYLKLFLCSVYSPVCTPRGIVPPCKELCEIVKSDCHQIAKMFGIEWPQRLNCEYYPTSKTAGNEGDNVEDMDYRLSDDNMFLVNRQTSTLLAETLLNEGKVCIPPSSVDVVIPAILQAEEDNPASTQNESNKNYLDFGTWCPDNMRAPPGHYGYTFMGLPNCTAPCPNMYLNESELWIVRYLILAIAVICSLVTSFTILTFIIDTKRFRYPERPIVFYAFSYLVVSVVFLVGIGLQEKAACNEQIINENNEIVQGFAVVEGSSHRLCSIMFMILYYFTVNGTIWWLILTITWLLAAGFSWGSEAIENLYLYYHAVAWGLPAVQTLVVFVSNRIEGDNIAGVCFVGLYDSDALRYLLLLPMCTYLLIGIVNLFTGFFYLNRVRKKLDGDQKNKEKLAKFMLRIGVFSVLYILPQIALLVIYVVEDINRKYWEAAWYAKSCVENSIPCPAPNHPVGKLALDSSHPGMFMFCMRYMMTLIVALPPLFWVASRKTLASWKYFCSRNKSDLRYQMNSTQTRLLNDSNGPHARDMQANLRGRLDSPDPVFGKMGNPDLCGSSASVAAAQLASKRPVNSRKMQWDQLTDSDSTDFGTSMMDSELSRVLAYESRKNKGVRVPGRQSSRAKPHVAHQQVPLRNNREEGVSSDQVTSSLVRHKARHHQLSEKGSLQSKSRTLNSLRENKDTRHNIAGVQPGSSAEEHKTKHDYQKLPAKSGRQRINYNTNEKHTISNKPALLPKENKVTILPQSHVTAQSAQNGSSSKRTPETSSLQNVSSKSSSSSRKSKTPPPVPPPRVDSVVVLDNLSAERALSI